MSAFSGGTLSLDVGGSGIKGMVLNPEGDPINDRIRILTPRPATPEAIIDTIAAIATQQPPFQRVSVGFPGVVERGVVKSAPNLDGDWSNIPLAAQVEAVTGQPCRVANDADVQGYGVIQGVGVEVVLTLGTGMGSAVFSNGHLVPNLELGHHPLAEGKTYEDWIGKPARKAMGDEQWNHWVEQAVKQVLATWNPHRLYLGGGNAKHLTFDLPEQVRVIPNVAGILGGIRLWEDELH